MTTCVGHDDVCLGHDVTTCVGHDDVCVWDMT